MSRLPRRALRAPIGPWTPTSGCHWLDEHDPYVDVMGVEGVGEIGIVGTAAAVSNAVLHATGVRVRGLPVTLDTLLPGLP